MLKKINTTKKNFLNNLEFLLDKRRTYVPKKHTLVKRIIKEVKKNGNKAIIKYEKKFNNYKKLEIRNLKYTDKEIKNIIKKLNKKTKKSIDLAYRRIFNFHKNQKFKSYKMIDSHNNNFSYISSPIERVGIYVPGGKASYPSTVLMNSIPAIVAGVNEIYMTTPSSKKNFNPAVIYAAKKCGIKEIYKVGGAQAIAGMTFGTSVIKKVNKIVGPGNEYVAMAKKEVFGIVGIDMIAGPSEVTVVADKFSNPEWIAADLIAQSEHDEQSQSILISNSEKTISKINSSLKKQLMSLKKRKIALKSLKNFGIAILSKTSKKIPMIINTIAPEHLEICTKNPELILKNVKNAGSIFLGNYSPEAMGDYIAGPNHVLPTTGSAKFSSGLSVYDFLKRHSVIKISKSGIERLGPSVINLSQYENLDGHAYSVKIRLKRKK